MYNIIYINTHDSGRIISPYGYKTNTPNMENFAKESILFKNAFCCGPTCSPSRASLLSGMYPHQNGMLGLAQRGFSMDYEKHLVQFLNSNNYFTLLSGIQHESGWYLEPEKNAKIIGYKKELSSDCTKYSQEELINWDIENAELTSNWLKNYDKNSPLFLSYGMYATHRKFPKIREEEAKYITPPYPIPDTKETREDFSGFLKSVNNADKCIGKVISSLKENGYWDNSIVIMTTDHGIANPFSKCTLFDSGIGVFLMIYVPNSIMNGKVVDSLVSHIDIFPTLCDILGIEKPSYLEGKSLKPIIDGTQEKVRDEIYSEINFHTSYEPTRCVRTERYKYIRYYDTDYLKINLSNIDESKTKDFFLNNDLRSKLKYEEALYDLVYDVGERNNLINDNKYTNVKNKLIKLLEEQQINTHDPLLNNEIKYNPKWKVNKKECEFASSKNPNDYVTE